MTPAEFAKAKAAAIARHKASLPEQYAWDPSPEEFAAFKARDLHLAQVNLQVRGVERPEDTLHNPLTFARAKKRIARR